MEHLPQELQPAIVELRRDYDGFKFHPVGANGYLVFAKNRISGSDVAIKFYYGAPGERRHDEPRRLASIQSSNILPIIDARNISAEWALFITPRCSDGDLDILIAKRPSALQAIDVALGICTGASAIHANGLVHRDLKPGNVVCEKGVPLIADFGSVRQLAEGEKDIPASGHSALYRPPESYETGRYSVQGDVYQIGLVTYQLLGGALPYNPLDYFRKSDIKQYAEISDDFQKSAFQDAVIHRRAASADLMDLRTLPPWVGGGAQKALRAITHPDLNKRPRNMGDVAAMLSRVRADMSDWRWEGDIARLERAGRIIELRPAGDGQFEPLQTKGDAFRRIPSLQNGPLKDLVRNIG